MYLTKVMKEQVYTAGFNLVDVTFWEGGEQVFCIVCFITPEGDMKGKITEVGELDIFNAIVSTCKTGTPIRHTKVTKAIFCNLDKNISYWKKNFPKHFN